MTQWKQNTVKLCSTGCNRPIDTDERCKTCCKPCTTQKGKPSNHDPVCDVRYYEYKQNKRNQSNNNHNSHNSNDNVPWQCILCNWSNQSTVNNCKMCDKPKPNKKRKLEESTDSKDICPDSMESIHINQLKSDHDHNHNRPNKRRKLSTNNVLNEISLENNNYDILNEKYLEIKESEKELNQTILEQNDLLNVYKKKNDALQKRLDLMEGKVDNMDTLCLDELNELKLKMLSQIKLIEDTEKQLIDNTYKCIACMDRSKNVSFTDGCSHIALCDECEAKLTSKLCPLCQTPYKNVKKINF